jgi:uncharacterized protein
MANEGAAWPLIEGTGSYYGIYVIESLSERKSALLSATAPPSQHRVRPSLCSASMKTARDRLGVLTDATARALGLA